ncbi:g2819 [Coccomyxa elongata]
MTHRIGSLTGPALGAPLRGALAVSVLMAPHLACHLIARQNRSNRAVDALHEKKEVLPAASWRLAPHTVCAAGGWHRARTAGRLAAPVIASGAAPRDLADQHNTGVLEPA